MNRIILASASPRRVELLASLGVDFEVVPSRAEELHDEKIEPAILCESNAGLKAADIAARHPGRVVLGADTLVTLDGKLFGKPTDLRDAAKMLQTLSGREHQVITGVCLLNGTRKSVFHEATTVRFKPLTPEVIEAYLGAVPVLDKAGGYAVQEKGEMLVAEVIGSFSNVVGLPVERLAQELSAWGIDHNRRNR